MILHPLVTCGFAGDYVHCEASAFRGIDTDGGMADIIRTSTRSMVKLGRVPIGCLVEAAVIVRRAKLSVVQGGSYCEVCAI